MKAMILPKIVSLDEVDSPLKLVDLPTPVAGPGEILVKVAACGVCHTELDEIEGRTAPPRLPVVLGHEVVGRVERLAQGFRDFSPAIVSEWVGFIRRAAQRTRT